MAFGHQTLRESSKSALIWSGGFTFFRDVAQFAVMLIMVRLLTPQDYGNAALAQSILGFLAVASFGTFASHALQLRDPAAVDWQSHFTAAAVINTALFALTLVFSWAISYTDTYRTASLPLAGLATSFLVEIPGTLRHRMLETQHDWARFRLLLVVGTVLGLSIGLIVALLGGGVWALVVQVPLFGLPAAIDLFWGAQWRPNWSWNWSRYRASFRFGLNRMGAAAAQRGRQTVEQTVLAGTYDFAALGVFTRTVGLATLLAGRIGSITTQALYPVLTRASKGSEAFQRMAGLVLRGVCWTAVPAASFLAISAQDTVGLLYGGQWTAVAPLLPVAATGVAFTGIAGAVSNLLLANDEVRLCLIIDVVAACVAVVLALLFVPVGVGAYLASLAAHGFLLLMFALRALKATGGIARAAILPAFLPALIASGGATCVVVTLKLLGWHGDVLALRFVEDLFLFSLTYLLVLRVIFPSALKELLDVSPGGARLMNMISLSRAS